MRVTLLGTGSADGWPNPFCGCRSCESARRDGVVRAQTSALVDDVLLLDCGPETLRQAERCGRSLADVTTVLVTHAHPDHFDPAFLLYRRWVTDRPVHLLGPPGVIDACAHWLAPGSAVTITPLAPGEAVQLDGYRVRALPARHEAPGGALLYDVAAADGDRLLYATDTGPLTREDLAAIAQGPAYSVVLLEETFGDHVEHGTDHLDLVSFAGVLSGLREAGAVDAHTDVVAVHLSHHNPPVRELRRRLRGYGARVVGDGSTVGRGVVPDPAAARLAVPGRTLITGGARSGKSREAERMLLAEPEVVYVATGVGSPSPDDPAWQRRVAAHRERRPASWRTVETLDLVPLLAEDGPPVLVDCLTLWLAGVLERLGAWGDDAAWGDDGREDSGDVAGADSDGGDDARVEKAVEAEIDALVRAWRETPRRVVAVTNEVGSGVVPGTVSGGRFRDLLGRLNAMVAAESEQVLLCVAGRVIPL